MNYRNRRLVFKDKIKINGEEKIIYIKKYVPHKKPKRLIILGFKDDPCTHYKKVAKKLKKIGINVAEAVLTLEKRESFFYRKYILVTLDKGKSLQEYEEKFKEYKKFYIKYFDYFILMCKNKIYPTDYNLGGCLINQNDIILIDLDSYKQNKKINKTLIIKILKGLEGNYLIGNHEEYFIKFFKQQIDRVKKELKWEEIY